MISTGENRDKTASKNDVDEEENNEPIKYSTSKAASHLAAHTRFTPSDAPEYQPTVVALSLAVFMIYFCILREENDVDENLYRPLSETVPNFDKLTKQGEFVGGNYELAYQKAMGTHPTTGFVAK